MAGFAVAVHGGAGLIRRQSLTEERERACRQALAGAIQAATDVLQRGGSALDAVVAAVMVLEDAPVFNAGRGSVFAANGTIEMDAAVMDGADRRAGAVTCVRTVRNPVRLARAVMEQTPHVFVAHAGAEALARELGIETVDPDQWHRTEERWRQLVEAQKDGGLHLDHGGGDKDVFGTVGAVALDRSGHLAAATSTGGMVNKRPGRVGDTPVIGAGTWADDATCAVSGTGHGELFVRTAVGARISNWMEMGGLTLEEAARRVVHDELPRIGGVGGAIAVDREGNLALPFNSGGMFRGWAREGEPVQVEIW